LTLRLRLVLGLVVLVLAGLTLFGFATYSVYARSQYQRLDEQMASSVGFVSRELSPGLPGPEGGGHEHDHGAGPPPAGLSAATYAELRDPSNTIQSVLQPDASAKPRLPSVIQLDSSEHPRHFTTGSALGSGTWRVYVVSAPGPDNHLVVIAVPTGEVTTALHRLVLIETSGGIALLAILSIGAWLILRHGLRPLEQMATTAGQITGGDLSQRVTPSGGPSEVGQLGLALNTMLADIEASFAEREATELRLRQFLSDASHELRTPLTSIQGFAELFRIGPGAQEVDLPTIMRRIEQESARMKGLVEDLLLLARLDETRPIERQPVDLAVLAADACSDSVAVAPDHPITLDAPAPVVVLGDQAHLRQAIGNLVANAARHTPAGTGIDVSASLDDGTAQVVVRDHGPGLDADAVAHVFDRFWQADKARVGAGAGLGLPIVAAIASEHGGSAVAANADDGGAMFVLRLPQQ
jgi:two-component system, OmpR family, sensor kinase